MQQLSELTLKAPHEKSPAENQRRDYSRLWLALVMISLIGLTIVSFTQFDTKGVDIPEAALASLNNIRVMFQELRLSHISLQTALINVLITFSLALITTFIAALISFFLALLAAKNFSSGLMSNIVKGLVAFIRAVPTVLWVLIFAISAGLGAEACVMGLCFHAVGYLTKAYSEVIEEMDMGPVEALRASGASFWQVVFQGVLPSVLSYFLAWTFMRFEINYMAAIAMGAAAGAGGIGFDLFMSGSFYYDIREVGAITVIILLSVLLLEIVSVRLKRRLQSS